MISFISSNNPVPESIPQEISTSMVGDSPSSSKTNSNLTKDAFANLGMVIKVIKVPPQVSCDDLSLYFSIYGTLLTVETPRPRPGEGPTAYLSFSRFETVCPSIFTSPHQIDGIPISINISSKLDLMEVLNSEPDFPPDSRTILLKNLPFDTQFEDLENFLESKNLEIESIRISDPKIST